MLRSIREKHGGEGVRLLGGRIVTLWGPAAIQRGARKSADVYDSGGRQGQGHVALPARRADAVARRRVEGPPPFNESVLATRNRSTPTPLASCAWWPRRSSACPCARSSTGTRFEELFDKVTLRVIFGDGAATTPS